MAQKKLNAVEAFLALSDADKARVVAEFAPGKPRPKGRALTAAEQAVWERARRRRGRPPKGEGAEPVNVTIERGLLRRADAYAADRGLSRARLIAIALENLLPPATSAKPRGGGKARQALQGQGKRPSPSTAPGTAA